MVKRRLRRRPRQAMRPQLFKETGMVNLANQSAYAVGADGIEVPVTRSFKAIALTISASSPKPVALNIELFGSMNNCAWRSKPILVGPNATTRTYRWPTSAGAMFPSTSKNTLFRIISPCTGDGKGVASVIYTVSVKLSADYDRQDCPKMHGTISELKTSLKALSISSDAQQGPSGL